MKPEHHKPATDESVSLPLGLIEHEIFTRRTRQGKAIFKDPDTFSKKLHALAHEYAKQAVTVQCQESRQRYRAVAKAANHLQNALLALREDELKRLDWQQTQCLDAYLSTLATDDDPYYDLAPDTANDTLHPRNATCLRWSNELIWLNAGAEQLSKSSRKGRPNDSAEFWVAREFVELCHQEGWPLTAASSGSERKNGARPIESDSIRCLAAVFVAAGKHPVESLRHAKTMLRKFRQPQTYQKWEDSEYYDDGPIHITMSLKERRTHLHPDISALPNFIPQGC